MIWGVFDRTSRAQHKGGDPFLGCLTADSSPSANSLGQDIQIFAVVRVVAAESGNPRVSLHTLHTVIYYSPNAQEMFWSL